MSRSISLLLASSLFLAVLALPVHAGSQQAPEVTDPEHDIVPLALACQDTSPAPTGVVCFPGCGLPTAPAGIACIGDLSDASKTDAGLGGDITAAWIDHENATSFLVNIQTHADPTVGLASDPAGAGPKAAEVRLTANFTLNGVTRSAVAHFTGDGMSVGGVATALSFNATGFITSLTVDKAAFGSFTPSSNTTTLFVVGTSRVIGSKVDNPGAPPPVPGTLLGPGTETLFYDRAPDSGFGQAYNFTGGASNGTVTPPSDPNLGGAPGCTYKSGETNRTDRDADCLPDYWEKKYFGGTSQQNGTGDPDGDGCNNRCEYLHGTDPTKKDTDGDGFSDGDEIKAGTDPTNPASYPGSGTVHTTTTQPTSASVTTGVSTTSGTTGAPATSTSQSPLDKIQADSGYAVASGAAMGAVVLISLIGLFGRWGA